MSTVTADTGLQAAAVREDTLLEVRNLVKHFPIKSGLLIDRQVGAVQAVDDVSFSVAEGERAWQVWRWPWTVRWNRIFKLVR